MSRAESNEAAAGRSCPLHYRYRTSDFAVEPAWRCDVLYVVGGLYGNEAALAEILRLFALERGNKRLVFNGDFHWFDTDPAVFERITQTVLSFDAIRGNVETEIADPAADDAGCGCAYPDWVGQGVVERSNRIITRLRRTAGRFPQLQQRLRDLPMWLRVDVGETRVAIVHGDAQSLAGWGFAAEHLRDAGHRRQVRGWFDAAAVDLFASTHTCTPVLQTWGRPGAARLAVINNGAAEGLLTRIATTPIGAAQRRFGSRIGGVHLDAVAIGYDDARWQREFLAEWPAGSDAHASYWQRIAGAAGCNADDVVRAEVEL